jgi:hypothetical protein
VALFHFGFAHGDPRRPRRGSPPCLLGVNRRRSSPAENRSMSVMPPITTKFPILPKCREGPDSDIGFEAVEQVRHYPATKAAPRLDINQCS